MAAGPKNPGTGSKNTGTIVTVIVICVLLSILGFAVWWFRDTLFPPTVEGTQSPSPSTAPSGTGGSTGPSAYNDSTLGGAPLSVTPGVPSGPSGPSGPSPNTPPETGQCVGYWSNCSRDCTGGPNKLTSEQTFTWVSGDKSTCVNPDDGVTPVQVGATKSCSSSLPQCGQDCEGSWSNWSKCTNTCGYATKTRTFTVTPGKEPTEGGKFCNDPSLGHGPTATGDGATDTQPCTVADSDLGYTSAQCSTARDCVGSWVDTNTCTKSCGGGVKRQTFTVLPGQDKQDGADGTIGKTCQEVYGATHGQSRDGTTPCNTNSCCGEIVMANWERDGSILCSGNASGLPEQRWKRSTVYLPQEIGASQITSVCQIPTMATTKTSVDTRTGYQNCPDVLPTGGTCTNGGSYNIATGCTSLQPVRRQFTCAKSHKYTDAGGNIYYTVNDRQSAIDAGIASDPNYENGCYKKDRICELRSGQGCVRFGYTAAARIQETSVTSCPPAPYYPRANSQSICDAQASAIATLRCPRYFTFAKIASNRCGAATDPDGGHLGPPP